MSSGSKISLLRFSFIQIWVFLVVTTNGFPSSSITDENDDNVCQSEYCLKTANELLQSIDKTADPCENFYQFTCGNWIENTTLTYRYASETRSVLGNMEEKLNKDIVDLLSTPPPKGTVEAKAITNARKLFESCSGVYSYETGDVFDVLYLVDKEFGGWPVWKDSAWGRKKFDLAEVLLKMNQYNFRPIFDVQTKVDNNYLDIKNYNQRNNLSESTSNSQQFTNDQKYITFDLSLSIRTISSPTDATNMDVYRFETAIYNYFQQDKTDSKTQTTVKNISQLFGTNFDFGDYIRRVYLDANITLGDNDIIVIQSLDDIKNISSLIAQQSINTLQEYLVGKFLENVGFSMSTVRKILRRYPSQIFESNPYEESWKLPCAQWVNDRMGHAVSKLYLDKYFDDETKTEATKMIQNIQQTFIEMINQSTWIDDVSKRAAIEKTKTMVNHVGYPEYMFIDNMKKLENLYSEYKFDSIYIKNVLTLTKIMAKQYFKQLQNPNGDDEWSGKFPTSSNAYYILSFNKIIVPAAYLQPTLFHKDVPKYLNYGGTGCYVGHEFGHGFDDTFRHRDKDGKKYLSWSGEVNEKFVERTKCLVEQYNGYKATQIYEDINGYSTLYENDADDHGLKIAFQAYKKWVNDENIVEQSLPGLEQYTPEQLFFINYGYHRCSKMNDPAMQQYLNIQNHALPEFRINGPTSNFAEFDRVFQCQPGQGNSRMNKCGVW